MAGFKSERWPASDRNRWPASYWNAWPASSESAAAALLIDALGRKGQAEPYDFPDGGNVGGRVVVIVGMHRAGTSLCAKIVNRLGFALGGPLMPASFDNPDGFQEHMGIVDQHEALLSHLGAAWDTFWTVRFDHDERLSSAEAGPILNKLRSIVTEEVRKAGGRWAFKDPRATSFLPVWMRLFDSLGIEPVWLVAIRDPRAVAASLHARNRLPRELGELLWTEHYLNALRHLGPRISGLIHYEKWFSEASKQIEIISNVLGINTNDKMGDAEHSIDINRKHNLEITDNYALGAARNVYSWLRDEPLNFRELQWKAQAAW